jgi:hypothetical protein
MLPGRSTGDSDRGEGDSGGVVGNISKDSEEARLLRRRGAEDPSAAGPSPCWAADLASVPDSMGWEASGG